MIIKRMFVTLSVALIVALSANVASACYKYPRCNHYNFYEDNSVNNKATATAGAIGVGIAKGGDGGNAKAVIEDGAIRNTNRVNNNVDNTNVNLNLNKVENDVDVRQNQGQTQGQSMAAFLGQGNVQKITIEEADNPVAFGHISPDVGKTDADMADPVEGTSLIRLMFSLFKYDDDNFITMDEAKKASSGADIEVIPSLLWEPDVQLAKVQWDGNVSGKYMGSLTLLTEDATADQMAAQAAEEAMLAGATSYKMIMKDAIVINGVKYGIDFGSSASVALNPDTGSAVLAPGATLGWSKAKADNKWVKDVYLELFHDASLLVD